MLYIVLLAQCLPGESMGQEPVNNIRLEVGVEKRSVLQGEIIPLTITAKNKSTIQSAYLPCDVVKGIATGTVYIVIEHNTEGFKKYRGPGWGIADTFCKEPLFSLPPNEKLDIQTTILFNHAPDTKHLSDIYAKQHSDEITTNYAFQDIGRYNIKAILSYAMLDGKINFIESPPIEIIVSAPSGRDAEIWREFKDNPLLGRFAQTGDLPFPSESSQGQAFIDKLQTILDKYAESEHKTIERLRAKLIERRLR